MKKIIIVVVSLASRLGCEIAAAHPLQPPAEGSPADAETFRDCFLR